MNKQAQHTRGNVAASNPLPSTPPAQKPGSTTANTPGVQGAKPPTDAAKPSIAADKIIGTSGGEKKKS